MSLSYDLQLKVKEHIVLLLSHYRHIVFSGKSPLELHFSYFYFDDFLCMYIHLYIEGGHAWCKGFDFYQYLHFWEVDNMCYFGVYTCIYKQFIAFLNDSSYSELHYSGRCSPIFKIEYFKITLCICSGNICV